MNTALLTTQPAAGRRHTGRRASLPAEAAKPRAWVPARRGAESVVLRTAEAADAPALFALIDANLAEGHLLPRSLEELSVHASRFVVAVGHSSASRGRSILGCAELAPLSASVAEVRSLVVDRSARSRGIGRQLVDALRRKAVLEGFEKLTAFTHDAAYFVRQGFSIVPHVWVPEKIALDCHQCPLFRKCGQHAVVLPLARRRN
jgi:amino-acid N-acetyltransferase